jgi:hypothetical protein
MPLTNSWSWHCLSGLCMTLVTNESSVRSASISAHSVDMHLVQSRSVAVVLRVVGDSFGQHA